jgi:hypothetical protein
MNEKPESPWYSFRWMILFWIALPFAIIAAVDVTVMWLKRQ